MEALQYIYTSWKNGDSTEKGYMIYSKSLGITDAECAAIKDAMQYMAPKELTLTPSQEEIADLFPYAFSYFLLPTGRGCVAQSTYLGRDYSGRFGNYIIYALVFDTDELPCLPGEMFAEPYIKTFMTSQELDAPSPVPPLPPLEIEDFGSVINDDQLNEFLFDKEDEFAQVISMVLAARDAGVPFYLNDTRENLVLWSAAVQRVLPACIAKTFTFNTYVGDHEAMRSPRMREEGLDFCLTGVRPDANYFNYATEYRSNRHLVMDFLGGYMTPDIPPLRFAQAMAASITMDFEDVERFGDFVGGTSFRQLSGRLEDAYLVCQLLHQEDLELTQETIRAILTFGQEFCMEEDRTEIGSKLLERIQQEMLPLTPDNLVLLWDYVCSHTGYMLYTLFDLVLDSMYQYAGEAQEACAYLHQLLQKLSQAQPQRYGEFLDHLNSAGAVEHMLMYLADHENLHTNHFYLQLLLDSYPFSYGLEDGQPVSRLMAALLHNLTAIPGSDRCMLELLLKISGNTQLFGHAMEVLMGAMRDADRLEELCNHYVELSARLPEKTVVRFERLLLETQGAVPIVIRLAARKIAASRDPEEEFWRFYDSQRVRITPESGFAIDPMVMACLQNIHQDHRLEVAADMMRDLEPELFRNSGCVRLVTDIFNGASVKELSKIQRPLLQKACKLRAKLERTGMEKVRAVYIGELLRSSNASQRKRPVSLAEDVAQKGIRLAGYTRLDYEAYCKYYLPEFFTLLQSLEDIFAMMQIFFHGEFFPDFCGDYLGALRKLQKKDEVRWERIAVNTCVFLTQADQEDAAAEELYKPMLRYLRGLDEDDLLQLRNSRPQNVPPEDWEHLFDAIRRKEGFGEKLGGIFRRK